MNTNFIVQPVKTFKGVIRGIRFYTKGYHKVTRPSLFEALAKELLFVDFKGGSIKNFHAKHVPDQHIAYWSPELADDIDFVNSQFKILKAILNKELRLLNESILNGENKDSFDERMKKIEDIKQKEVVFFQERNTAIIEKYYDKITLFGLGFYHIYK